MQSLPKRNMMIDCETTSLLPCEGRVTSVGWVIFDENLQTIKGGTYEARLIYQYSESKHFIDNPETMEFRKKYNIDAHETEMEGYSVRIFLERLRNEWHWQDQDMFIWAKPMDFDLPFLRRLGHLFGTPVPWTHRQVVDMRSFCMGLGLHAEKIVEIEKKTVPFDGDIHTPRADAKHQLEVLQYCVAQWREQ